MSTIQQLKNFIRHGKQARAANEEAVRKVDSPPSKQPNTHDKRKSVSDPLVPQSVAAELLSEPAEKVARKEDSATKRASRRVDDANLAKLVAEENASRTKFPQYPGLERWVLLEKMGDGAFSNVYRARDTEGQYGEVAIKVVRKYEMNNMQRANILKEVQIMRQLDHPNVIKLIDFSESKPYYYIVLELAPGGELFHQIVRLTYFSEELSRHVIVKVAKALEYLHEDKGVVHRDIKPENILFNPIDFLPSKVPKPRQPGDEDKVDEGEFLPGIGAGGIGEIKIADFGLSKIVWDKQTMTPCGTVGYTAPEIVKDERYSKSVDMWALGCVLYTLLCGFPPFYDESIEILTEKVAKGQYTFLSPWWDDISKSAKDLISHLLTVDPEKRYTITEFLAHPWVRASGPTPREERKPEAPLRAFDPSKLDDGRRLDFRSPGAVNLREVFDVGYAVHRQEEEAKRRAQIGARAGPGRPLGGLNEEDEEEEMEVDKQAQGSARVLEQGMRKASIQDQDTNPRGRERERATNEKGYGQHSSAVTAAARQQVRDRNRNKGPFELNLDNATLLGKRGKKMPAVGA
ncbi:Calcium/calmodulin-dependent-like protein kinase [Cordyceps fumosorosea ARSEF 2679]|uniref:Calcium/calmodulin-dependent-like protein kinase n=1 Tax=Cordyceps fumosorosea (strain ARSEF 2679) TaxID=1081104 RepID=A0A167V255_CORFA|nr:Calcium/calmodulin-dependent-like protein kinase [Cordyceps fumosorosea ARSEF 2679]OAA62145.1 Calcium/calmodulin-dependent-like protein kinase [Cordyceps fumosorosea ARSEF 2679]